MTESNDTLTTPETQDAFNGRRERTTIIRRQKYSASKFFTTSRSAAQDSRLSFEARGLLWYLLSKPDDWDVRVADIQREANIGRDKAYRLLRELVDAKYISRTAILDSKHRVMYVEYTVFEVPLPEKPDTDSPDTENPHIYKETETATKRKTSLLANGRTSTEPVVKEQKRQPNPNWDAVAKAYGTTNAGLITNYCGFYFHDRKVKGEWDSFKPATPFTIEEFEKFVPFALNRMEGMKKGRTMPTSPEAIAKAVDEFRAGASPNRDPRAITQGTATNPLAGMKVLN